MQMVMQCIVAILSGTLKLATDDFKADENEHFSNNLYKEWILPFYQK